MEGLAPFNNSHDLQGLFLGLLLSLKRPNPLRMPWPVVEVHVVWASKVDGQMDGCAQGCVKEGALKIGFLVPRPLRPGRLNTTWKIEGGSGSGDGGLSPAALSEKARSCSFFSPAQIPHPIISLWLHLPIGTKVGGVALGGGGGGGGGGGWQAHTPRHTFLARQAATARQECQNEDSVCQM